MWLKQVVLVISSYSSHAIASSGVYKVLNVQNDELYKMVAILLLSLGMACYVAIGDWNRAGNVLRTVLQENSKGMPLVGSLNF